MGLMSAALLSDFTTLPPNDAVNDRGSRVGIVDRGGDAAKLQRCDGISGDPKTKMIERRRERRSLPAAKGWGRDGEGGSRRSGKRAAAGCVSR